MDNLHVPFIEFDLIFPIDHVLRCLDEYVKIVSQWMVGHPMIDQVGPFLVYSFLKLNFVLGEAELFQVSMEFEDDGRSRGLIDLSAFEIHNPVLKYIDLTDRMGTPDNIQFRDDLAQKPPFPVQFNRDSLFKLQSEENGLIGRLLGWPVPHPDIIWKRLVQVDRSTCNRSAPHRLIIAPCDHLGHWNTPFLTQLLFF